MSAGGVKIPGPPMPGGVSGVVFQDLDADGRRDRGEWPLPGVTVFLDNDGDGINNSGSLAASVTGPDGSFAIGSIYGGAHALRLEPPAGWHRAAGLPDAVGFYLNQTGLHHGWRVQDRRLKPIPLTRAGGIQGRAFLDVDADGVASADAVGVPGGRLFVDLNRDNVWRRGEPLARTDRGGNWHFSNRPAGTHRVIILMGRPYFPSIPPSSSVDVTLSEGQVVKDVLFGLRRD